MTTIEVLQQCTIEGLVIKLPSEQLDRKVYTDVKSALEKIGGKWTGGKVFGFVFKSDPTDLLADIAGGAKRNIKKEFQFFATPDALADQLVKLADLQPTNTVLEPSAGQGAIIDAVLRSEFAGWIDYIEKMPANKSVLETKYASINNVFKYEAPMDNFLIMSDLKVRKIIANPPFSKDQDVDHVRHMYDCLYRFGRLVSLVFDNWDTASKKKLVFIDWLREKRAVIIDVPSGTFKESGTSVPTKIVVIDKID